MVASDNEMLILCLENRKDVFYLPLKRSERIKFTTFTVSKNYIIFGATSGGLYVFKRNPCSFWQLIPSKETAVSIVAVSLSENFVAFSTNKGIVCVVELNENSSGKLITRTQDLSNSEITALCWIDDNTKPTLFIGDSCGRISSLKLSFLNKNIVHVPTTIFMTLDSRVVQLCQKDDFLLVSTVTRCYICDMMKEQYKQIGQRLRDGYYGATFLKNEKKLFCARPGFRLWEVDFVGVVHSTHQFKHKLGTKPSSFVTIFEDAKICDEVVEHSLSSSRSGYVHNFTKMYDLNGQCVVTFDKDTIYVLNINTVEVVFWNRCFGQIKEVQCFENTIYVWNNNDDLYELVLLPLEKCLLTLYFKMHYHLCAELIYRYFKILISSPSSLSLLLPLRNTQWTQLQTSVECNADKIHVLSTFEEKLKCLPIENDFVKLNSGIHVVNNKFLSGRLLDDSLINTTTKYKTCNLQESDESSHVRRRSQSLPNDYRRRKHPKGSKNYSHSFSERDVIPQQPSVQCQMYTDLFLEMGVHNSPFVAMASYNILQDNFAELGFNFMDKFNVTSRSLMEKWRTFENTIKRYGGVGENINENGAERVSNVSRCSGDVDFDLENSAISNKNNYSQEPIVDLPQNTRTAIEVNFSEIISLLRNYNEGFTEVDAANVDAEANALVFDLMRAVVHEYTNVSRKYKFNAYQGFPFSENEKCAAELRTIFNAYFSKKFVLEWFQRDEHFLASDELRSEFKEIYPSLLLETFEEEELKLDYFLSKVLVIFAPLLNSLTIFETIKSFVFPCSYLTFCFILKYFQLGEPFERDNYRNSGLKSDSKIITWPTPVYLNTMLLMISVDQIDVFCEMGLKKAVDICDITYMMLYLEHVDIKNANESSNHCQNKYKNIWLAYLHRQCEQDCNGQLDTSLNDPNILRLLVKMFTSTSSAQSNSESCCTCWFLLPQQHSFACDEKLIRVGRVLLMQFWHIFQTMCLTIDTTSNDDRAECNHSSNNNCDNDCSDLVLHPYGYKTLLQLRRSINNTTEYSIFSRACYKNVESCKHLICQTFKLRHDVFSVTNTSLLLSLNIICSFCYRIPVLWKCVPSLQKCTEFKLLQAEHLIQLGNITELESLYQQMTVDDARTVLNWKSLISEGNCLNCANKISFNSEGGVSWNDLIVFILHRLGSKQTLEVLEEFSAITTLNKSFYRSAILTTLPGINVNSTRHVISAISGHSTMTPMSKNILNKLRVSLKQDKPRNEFKIRNSDIYHWGITTYADEGNQAICYCCSLPLFSKSLIKECNGGVFVFSCSHTYHTICLKNKDSTAVCLVCDRFLR